MVHNAEILRDLDQNIPIIFAGNVAAADDVLEIISTNGETSILSTMFIRE